MKYKVIKTNVGYVIQNTGTMTIVSDIIKTVADADRICNNLNKKETK